MQKLAVFDIDGTLFRWQLYHELVFELKSLGHFTNEQALELEQSLSSWQARRVSWRVYEDKVMETIEANITQITPDTLEQAARDVVARSGHKIYNYTASLLRQLKSEDYYCLAISASQQEIAGPFAAQFEFDDCMGAIYERLNGHYTGARTRVVHGRKHELIREYLAQRADLTLDGSVGIGDSDGDISMLQLVSTPIAFNPSEDLLRMAEMNDWRIVIERKNIAYTLEGRDGSIVLAETKSF